MSLATHLCGWGGGGVEGLAFNDKNIKIKSIKFIFLVHFFYNNVFILSKFWIHLDVALFVIVSKIGDDLWPLFHIGVQLCPFKHFCLDEIHVIYTIMYYYKSCWKWNVLTTYHFFCIVRKKHVFQYILLVYLCTLYIMYISVCYTVVIHNISHEIHCRKIY